MKKVDNSLILRLCLPQFAVGLFTTMLNNYLIYFYQPSKESGIPNLIPQGRLVLGVLTIIGMIKAIGHIIDAVTDPLIAAGSDKSRHKDGRRIPMMKKAAIPFGDILPLCSTVLFFTVSHRGSISLPHPGERLRQIRPAENVSRETAYFARRIGCNSDRCAL